MRAALVGLLGYAVCAPGQDIPVYREYTQPILFYDEQGVVQEFHDMGLDLVLLRAQKDSRAQEGWLGKETVLDMTFGAGASIFGGPAAVPGKMTLTPDGRQDRRRQQNESSQNWLAKSLSLPSLGQMPTNAASSAISVGAAESSWGWLADEVAGQPGDAASRPADPRAQDEYNPLAGQEATMADGNNPFSTEYAEANVGKEKDAEPATSASFPENVDAGQKPSERATERSEAAIRDLEGGDRTASPTMKDYRASAPMAEMNQTRQMIAELSAGAQADLATFRAAVIGVPSGFGSGAEPTMAGRESPNFSSSSGGTTAWGALGGRQGIGSSSMRTPAPAISSWQGGWSAQRAEVGGSVLSRLETPSDPVPVAISPVVQPSRLQSGTSSGGYKPAWF